MRILTLKFKESESDRDYDLLLDIFRYSAELNMSDIKFQILSPPLPLKEENKTYFMTKNTVKLNYWIQAILCSDEETIIMDCDMLILKDISDAFDKYDFDIALTKRDNYRVPFNGGMVFVRPNKKSFSFLEKWKEINLQMYNDPSFHHSWRRKYAGMNQSSLGWTFENLGNTLKIITLPCSEWNLCQEDWDKVNENSRCLHIKSELRKSIFLGKCKDESFKKAYDLWMSYKEKALGNKTISI